MKPTSYLLFTYLEFAAFFCTTPFLSFHGSALLDFASLPQILPWEFWEYFLLFHLKQEIAAEGTSYEG